jgi:soluble lytic murein transglycosylase-like protein
MTQTVNAPSGLVLRTGQGLKTFASDVVSGFVEVAHNGFALVGLVLAFVLAALFFKPELRQHGESALRGWLVEREVQTVGFQVEPDAIERATAANPRDLPKQQALVASWISRKYRVAPEPISALVAEAYDIGAKTKIDPTLILAIMAIESSFNPFAQSPVGAQGLMQVMTDVHREKFEDFGGKHATFDPVTNLKVGVKVLQECIARAGGSVELGLRYYVGATSDATEGGYANKVIAEQMRLQQVAGGKNPPLFSPTPSPVIPVVAPANAAPMIRSTPPSQPAALAPSDSKSSDLTSS